jgi:hypothetical protein
MVDLRSTIINFLGSSDFSVGDSKFSDPFSK